MKADEWTPWIPCQRNDGSWVLSRPRDHYGRSRFASQYSAQRAAKVANTRECVRMAVQVAGEPKAIEGHVAYYSKQLSKDLGWSLARANRECQKWAEERILA